MILTGPEIRANVAHGVKDVKDGVRKLIGLTRHEDVTTMDYIHVDPYDPELVGPNSVDLRLGDRLLVYDEGFRRHGYFSRARDPVEPILGESIYVEGPMVGVRHTLDMQQENATKELEIPEEGLILWPGTLYLGRTIECIGSNKFVPIVEGRSSVGRLGIHVHVTAGFCDLGFKGTITLEIHVIHPVRIYPNIPICQAYFLEPKGAIELYKGRYMNQEEPTASRFALPKDEIRENVYKDLPNPESPEWDEEKHNPPMGGPPSWKE